jgi:hypothetical protein
MNGKNIDFNKVGDLVQTFAEGLVKDLQENLLKSDAIATGNLSQSINFEPLIITKTGVMFELIMDSYYKYVDKGVKGRDNSAKAPNSPYQYKDKRPPTKPIKDWLISKGYKPDFEHTKDENNKITKRSLVSATEKKTLEQLSLMKGKKFNLKKKLKKATMEDIMERFALATALNIQKNGLKATNFYSSVINEERFDKFKNELSEAFKQDIIISLK